MGILVVQHDEDKLDALALDLLRGDEVPEEVVEGQTPILESRPLEKGPTKGAAGLEKVQPDVVL